MLSILTCYWAALTDMTAFITHTDIDILCHVDVVCIGRIVIFTAITNFLVIHYSDRRMGCSIIISIR